MGGNTDQNFFALLARRLSKPYTPAFSDCAPNNFWNAKIHTLKKGKDKEKKWKQARVKVRQSLVAHDLVHS
eukprot:110111-Pelagomonas_calceolata.AAC.3